MNEFLKGNAEDGDFNQYWYSQRTIDTIVDVITSIGGRTAFLSTPSIYFSLPLELRAHSKVYDFDRKWESDAGFVFYDFNSPASLPDGDIGRFDVVVIDPPFITHEVWMKYVTSAKLLLKREGGKVILTTVNENAELLRAHFDAVPTRFQPSIPNLVYQYDLFTNFECPQFSVRNPEIPE